MTLDDFVKKYKGKYVEVAGSVDAINQCVDLANLYFREVLNVPIVEWTNAQDFPSKVSPDDFTWIKNTPTGIPQKGDVMIWKSATYGHIAIFVSGDEFSFTSFDQNWPVGSACQLVSHSYTNVIGWLHPKKEIMSDTMQISVADFEKLMKNSLDRDNLCEYLGFPKDTPLETLKNAIAGIKSRATDQENRAVKAEAELANREEQVSRLKQELLSTKELLNDTNNRLNSATKEYQKLIGDYKGQLISKQEVVDEYARKLGEANIRIAELEGKADFTSIIKFGQFEIIKYK